jgi:deoxyribonuclease-4
VTFHPGYYGKKKEEAYDNIKSGIIDVMDRIKKEGWKVKIAPECMGKVNVFGSYEEIAKLVKDTGCSFCLDFAHIMAREKKVDYANIKKLFPQKEWHVHFSGIEYGDKGEKRHIGTKKESWEKLLKNLPRNKDITIINESPRMIDDCVEGLKIYKKIK